MVNEIRLDFDRQRVVVAVKPFRLLPLWVAVIFIQLETGLVEQARHLQLSLMSDENIDIGESPHRGRWIHRARKYWTFHHHDWQACGGGYEGIAVGAQHERIRSGRALPGKRIVLYGIECAIVLEGREMAQHHRKNAMLLGLRQK